MKRFWDKVRKTKNCWLWEGAQSKQGYGFFRLEGKQTYAHRTIFLWTYGKIPKGFCVCHKCDNPSCIRPSHLFLGTYKDNLEDCRNKGRLNRAKGEKTGANKLREKDVLKIRDLYSFGLVTHRELALKYGVSEATIQFIIQRRKWKYL